MPSSRKPATRKTTSARKNTVGNGVTKGALKTPTQGAQPGEGQLEGVIEAGKIFENLARLREIRSDASGDDPTLQGVQKSILARMVILHGVERAQLAPECCRDAGRLFSGQSLEIANADDLAVGEKVPAKSEASTSEAITKKIVKATAEYDALAKNTNAGIVIKDEERTGSDRMMSPSLKEKLDKLATSVAAEWSGAKLRVTEACDEDNEHVGSSLHYEARAADLTTSPLEAAKLGRLGGLAVDAGLAWVWYENSAHIHVSVTK
jgi:hypothetical protein